MSFSKPNFGSEKQFSLIQEQCIEYEETEHYIVLESKARDLAAYPQPGQYRIVFGDSYRNVKKIELIGATIPDQNSVTSEPYLVLSIDEFDNLESSNQNNDNGFSILQLKTPNVSGAFINIDTLASSGTLKTFKTPIAKIDRMTISIKDYDGNTFSFGDDTLNSPPNKPLQNIFIFKITTEDRKREPLQYRNVY